MDKVSTDNILLKQNIGRVLVTKRHLVIGPQSWEMPSIESATLIIDYVRPTPLEIISDTKIQRAIWPGIALAVIAVLLFALQPTSAWLFFVVIILFLMGMLYVIWALDKNPKEIYGIRLNLIRGPNLYSAYQPSYRWGSKVLAQNVLDAIAKAHTK